MNVSGALGSATGTSSRGGSSANVRIASSCRMARTEILIDRLMVLSLPDLRGLRAQHSSVTGRIIEVLRRAAFQAIADESQEVRLQQLQYVVARMPSGTGRRA